MTFPSRFSTPLGWALVASLVFHGVLLWDRPAGRHVAAAGALAVVLRAPPVVAPSPPPQEKTAIPEHKPPATTMASRALPAGDAPPVLAKTPLPAAVAGGTVPLTPPPHAVTADALPRHEGVASLSAGSTPGEGLDPEGLRGYRIALATQARHFKRYPPQARDAGWTGTADIQIGVTGNGATATRLAKSSGHGLLDEAAMFMMRQAAERATIPDSLRGRRFEVVLPVTFDLAAD